MLFKKPMAFHCRFEPPTPSAHETLRETAAALRPHFDVCETAAALRPHLDVCDVPEQPGASLSDICRRRRDYCTYTR
jgi:hypothetical protein